MSTDRQDPLDADERELARVLRALPAGEPPSALDARILAMARDAVVTSPAQEDEGQPRRRRAPRIAWGLGVAASCVFAAGLVWRMGGFGTTSFDVAGAEWRDDSTAPAASAEPTVQPAEPLPAARDEHISVEFGGPSTPTRTIAPPPPPPMEVANPRSAAASAPAAPAPAAEARAERAREQEAMRLAPLAAEPPAAEAAPASATLDRISVSGSRVSKASATRVVAEDSRAGPQAWLQRIRARIGRGDTDGARQSLEGFMERYPNKPLPQDLIDFDRSKGADDQGHDEG